MEGLLLLATIAAVLGLIPAAIAQSKGRSFGGFWVYGFFFFIIALIHAIIMKSERGSAQAETYANVHDSKSCPFCAETIKRAAVVCKHCGRELPAVATAMPSSSSAQPTSATMTARAASPHSREVPVGISTGSDPNFAGRAF